MLKEIRRIFYSKFWIHATLSIVYRLINPSKDIILILPKDEGWLAYNFTADYKMYYPYPEGVWHIANRKNEIIPEKYQKCGFVEVEDGDNIIDVGAFVGEFSCGVSSTANEIVACEPSPQTIDFLIKNTQKDKNITVIPAIVSGKNEVKTLHLSDDPTDDSTLNIDSNYSGISVGVPSVRISNIIEYSNFKTVDFLKVEAEGAEPEVLDSIGGLPIRKVAVDAGAERYGEKTVEKVSSILIECGFKVRSEDGMVYAKKDI